MINLTILMSTLTIIVGHLRIIKHDESLLTFPLLKAVVIRHGLISLNRHAVNPSGRGGLLRVIKTVDTAKLSERLLENMREEIQVPNSR